MGNNLWSIKTSKNKKRTENENNKENNKPR